MFEKIKSTLKDEKFQKAVIETGMTIVVAVAIKVVTNVIIANIGARLEAWNDSVQNEITAE
jgi:hypothetical protein